MIHHTVFSGIHLSERVAPRRSLQHAMLIGFEQEAYANIAKVLHRVPLIPQAFDEPYTALQALFEDPGSWMACIVNANAFSDELPLDRYLRLMDHQGHLCGVIVGNAPKDARANRSIDPVSSLDAAHCDVTDTAELDRALNIILRRRGFLRQAPEHSACGFEPMVLPATLPRRAAHVAPYRLTAEMRRDHSIGAALNLDTCGAVRPC